MPYFYKIILKKIIEKIHFSLSILWKFTFNENYDLMLNHLCVSNQIQRCI